VGMVVDNIGDVTSAEECCKLAEEHPDANAWTYCPNVNDCNAKYYQFAYQQCNLKVQVRTSGLGLIAAMHFHAE